MFIGAAKKEGVCLWGFRPQRREGIEYETFDGLDKKAHSTIGEDGGPRRR